MTTLADLLAETLTDKRGTCVRCQREDVPLNGEDLCMPCHLKTPGLDEAACHVAQRVVDRFVGKEDDGGEKN